MKINVVFLIIVLIGIPACSLPKSTTPARRGRSACALARQGNQHKHPLFLRRQGGGGGGGGGKAKGGGVFIVDKKTRKRPNPMLEWPNVNVGPKKNASYNPTWGYEPYWEGGDWVFDSVEPEDSDMCGSRCLSIYIDYGRICGRDKRYAHKTFENYCEMRNFDCTGKDAWMIAYRGECKTIRTFPTHEIRMATRVDQWLAKYSQRIYG